MIRFLFLFFVLINTALAETETMPSVKKSLGWYVNSNPSLIFPNAADAALSACSNYPNFTGEFSFPESTAALWVANLTGGSLSVTCRRDGGQGYFYTSNLPFTHSIGDACPDSSWTLTGTLCTRPQCPVNYDRNAAGQCVRDCTSKQGQPTENGSYQFSGAVSTWSVSGCRVRCPVRTLAAGGGRGDECVYTGASADPDDPPAEPDDRPDPDLDPPPEEPDDCLRRGQGYISGSNGISCVAPSDAPPGNRPVTENDKTDESGSPGPDGKPDPNSPDYKRNDSTAKNNGDGTITENGTETRKGTPDGDGYTCPDGYTKIGNGMCQKQWSKTQDENTFCQQNPKSPLCTGKLNDCEEGTDLARCLRLGKVPDGQEVQEKTIGVSYINPVAVATGGGCPAGIALPKGLGNFNWEPICTFATAIQPIVLVLAWMSAFFIVFGIKDD